MMFLLPVRVYFRLLTHLRLVILVMCFVFAHTPPPTTGMYISIANFWDWPCRYSSMSVCLCFPPKHIHISVITGRHLAWNNLIADRDKIWIWYQSVVGQSQFSLRHPLIDHSPKQQPLSPKCNILGQNIPVFKSLYLFINDPPLCECILLHLVIRHQYWP